ncbi:tetratricopeptide repeat protein [Actinoplanes sp. N902-109]|uniref:ATP-binding protein n=1 Tax=Actinoplanes sp. (strain N902-109) TaxID=649831 RepID=UPI0003294973|nr:helix-turn-helix domain-containing protein [Actinoplanes sp. N902-109]AGL16872.1 hypothetical protein L083_3362 [Actinoplanes sp. N902-109]
MFSAQMRAHRQRRGLTQEELAAGAGVSVRSIRNLESGRITNPRPGTVRSLADALGLRDTERDRFCESASDDPALVAAPAAGPAPGRPAPAQLPADVAGFVGRADHLRRLSELLDGTERPSAVVISAIAGTAGVGKTALAVRWAHTVRDRFPDGQLYVNLRGYDPDRPAEPGEVLTRFLNALGIAGSDVPADPDERAARYRTEIAGRRMLIVLDNAATVEQVRPLLPGSHSCAVLVTSRDSMAGLVAVHGGQRLELDLLPRADALDLLHRLIGERVDADPGAAATLAELCAHLPLALRVAVELAAARPATPLTELVAELADQQQRLELLDADGDPRASVTAVFSWSLRQLPPEVARAFRLAGLHPGPDFDEYAVAALAGTEPAPARRALGRLARAHLVHPTGPGRYGMHDLLRAYAMGLATEHETAPGCRAATGRLLDYYLSSAAAATECLQLTSGHANPDLPKAGTPAPDLTGRDPAQRWLDAERPCLVAATAHAAAHGWPGHAVGFSRTLYRYLEGGHWLDAMSVHGYARDAARLAGDAAGHAHALLGLSTITIPLGRIDTTAEHLEAALTLFQQVGDPIGEGRTLANLGVIAKRRGNYPAAVELGERALALFQSAGHSAGEGMALHNLGVIETHLGRFEAAVEHMTQALTSHRRTGQSNAEGVALHNLGLAAVGLGRYQEATRRYEEALALARRLAYSRLEAWALDGLGNIRTALGDPAAAIALHRQALTLFEGYGEPEGVARARNGLGEAAIAAGRPGEALTEHTRVLADRPPPDQRARACTGLGHACHARGDATAARAHYEQALRIYTEVGLDHHAGKVRAHLTALD